MPQDFSHQNLRGRSFKGQDLAGANFSYADIRGTDFTGANLRGANLTGVRAGLQNHWIVSLMLLSLLIMGVIGLVLAFNILWAKEYYLSFEGVQRNTLIPGIIVCISALVFGFIAVQRGFATALAAIALAIAVVGVSTVSVSGDKALLLVLTGAGSVVGAIFVTLIGSLAGAMIWADDWSVVQAVAFEWFLALILFLVIVSKIGMGILAVAWAGGFALAGGVVANYCARLILVKKQKFTLLQQMAAFVTQRGGTSFRHANLTDANFQKAELKSTDLRQANLTHTCWFQAQKLNLALVETTYLEKLVVQQLLTTRLGQNKNFDYQDLRGVNLQGANLTDASFIGADLSEANLQDADLTRAKLVQTQLDGTDFTGATLTGAYIEDWGITTDTKFDGVRCEYVYMRLPTPDNPDPHRKPDNRQEVFADGEFGDFIKPIFDTLDLYHNQGVDPRAIAISFKQLAENNPDAELEIVAMEKRGQDKFLLRAKTAIAADKSQLSAEYFATYNQLKVLAEQEVKALIAEKDSRIADLQNMVVTALQRPSFYSNVEQVGFMTNNPGGFSVGGSVSGDINNVQGDNNQQRVSNKTSNFNLQNAQFGGGLVNAENVNAGQIGGNITNYNPEQKQNLAQAAADIQQLLNQLSHSYPTATTSEKMTVVAKAVDEIENNPTLKARVIGALKAGGTEAFKELINHPLVNILLTSIEGWQDAE